jgi:hypothetical protein
MQNKYFIPYEQALELKELGFDEKCLAYYNIDPIFSKPFILIEESFDYKWCLPAPLYQQVFRWFREKYELSSWVYNSHMDKYFYTVLQDGRIVKANESTTTYEEAELACIKKLIELVKNK